MIFDRFDFYCLTRGSIMRKKAADSQCRAEPKPNVSLENHCSFRPAVFGAVFVKLKQQMYPRLGGIRRLL